LGQIPACAQAINGEKSRAMTMQETPAGQGFLQQWRTMMSDGG
jgi:hypothetical protein